jgi:GDP-4-dehydro-6-deoxy-D-mannose reductase
MSGRFPREARRLSKVLITGACGFLGPHIGRLCAESGHEVTGTYRNVRPSYVDEAHYVSVDLANEEATVRLLEKCSPDVIYHLAGQSSTMRSWADPAATFRDNVVAPINLFEACTRLPNFPRVLVASTGDVYGNHAGQHPIDEVISTSPDTPYSASKLCQELLAHEYADSRRVDVIVVRPFLQIGPGRSDAFFSGSFARQIVEISLGMRPPVVNTGNIDLIRDMTDVRDVANACVLLMDRGDASATYNIASSQPRRLRDLLDTMIDIAGVSVQIESQPSPNRGPEPSVLVGSADRLRAATGWQPNVSLHQSAADMLDDWRARIGAVHAPA